MRALLLCSLLWLSAGPGCSGRGAQSAAPKSPEQAAAELQRLARAGDAGGVYELLDQDSRWSLMSIHKDQHAICALVRASYPKERQARELERCRLADRARDAKAMFAAYARQEALLAKLAGQAPPRAELCQDGAGWRYCGLRAELERLKVKTARDAASIRENAEAFKGR